MDKIITLRKINNKDFSFLLDWRNDNLTRENSLNTNIINNNDHNIYIKQLQSNPYKKQFIMELNKKPVATIREEHKESAKVELSFMVNPKYRNKRIGQLLMNIYLLNKKGSFVCKVKANNIPSIKMIKKFGFILLKKENDINFYELNKT